jgi:hypothetical protein
MKIETNRHIKISELKKKWGSNLFVRRFLQGQTRREYEVKISEDKKNMRKLR